MPYEILDTCCLINLLASGHGAEILRSRGTKLFVPSAVSRELIYLEPLHAGPDQTRERIQLDLPSLGLEPTSPETEAEEQLYTELGAELDDGEAMALALARSRGLTLVTDEKKAKRLAKDRAVPVIGTSALIYEWARKKPAKVVNLAIQAISTRARFIPGKSDPYFAWWQKHLLP